MLIKRGPGSSRFVECWAGVSLRQICLSRSLVPSANMAPEIRSQRAVFFPIDGKRSANLKATGRAKARYRFVQAYVQGLKHLSHASGARSWNSLDTRFGLERRRSQMAVPVTAARPRAAVRRRARDYASLCQDVLCKAGKEKAISFQLADANFKTGQWGRSSIAAITIVHQHIGSVRHGRSRVARAQCPEEWSHRQTLGEDGVRLRREAMSWASISKRPACIRISIPRLSLFVGLRCHDMHRTQAAAREYCGRDHARRFGLLPAVLSGNGISARRRPRQSADGGLTISRRRRLSLLTRWPVR